VLQPLTSEQQELAARYYPLAQTRSARACRRYPWLATEVEGAALLGLVEAAAKYDPSRGVKFSTWVITTIDRRILDAAKRALRPNRDRRREETYGMFPPDILTEDPETDEADAMVGRLPDRESFVVRAVVLDGRTMRDVAEEMGCSCSNVARINHRGLERLRYRVRAFAG